MKCLLLIICMATASCLYPMSPEDNLECSTLRETINLFANIILEENNPSATETIFYASKATLKYFICRLDYLLNRYPTDPVLQEFAPIQRDTLQEFREQISC